MVQFWDCFLSQVMLFYWVFPFTPNIIRNHIMNYQIAYKNVAKNGFQPDTSLIACHGIQVVKLAFECFDDLVTASSHHLGDGQIDQSGNFVKR